jgi:hypothetical protein
MRYTPYEAYTYEVHTLEVHTCEMHAHEFGLLPPVCGDHSTLNQE